MFLFWDDFYVYIGGIMSFLLYGDDVDLIICGGCIYIFDFVDVVVGVLVVWDGVIIVFDVEVEVFVVCEIIEFDGCIVVFGINDVYLYGVWLGVWWLYFFFFDIFFD